MPRGLPTILFFMLVAVALAGAAYWLGSAQTATRAQVMPSPEHSPSFTAMAANVRLDNPNDGDNVWAKRRDLVAKIFLKYQADLIGCQEVSPAQGAFLNKELAQWYSYYPRAGVGSSAGGGGGRGVLGEVMGALSESLASLNTLYYRKDRFEIVDGEAGLLVPEEPQANASENVFFTLAVLKRKLPAEKLMTEPDPVEHLIVINTHLRHGDAFATKCATRLRERAAAWQEKFPNSGIVVMGDMNHFRPRPAYAALLGSGPGMQGLVLTDTFDYAKNVNGSLSTYHGFNGKPVNPGPSDLILYAGHVVLEKPAELVQDHEGTRWPSDHFFVLTSLRYKRSN